MRMSSWKAVVGAGVIAACGAFAAPASAIVVNDTFGDTNAKNLGAPFTAVVDIMKGSQFCSGTLIAANYVLTAQHCVHGFTAGDFSVVVKSSTNTTLNTVGVSSIVEFDGTSVLLDGTDLAVIQLASA